MARSITSPKLNSRTGRLKLAAGKRYWVKIAPGLSLGYRRPAKGSGVWLCRVLLDGKEPWFTIGSADDYENAGSGVFDFHGAQEVARQIAARERLPEHLKQGPLTVAQVMADYMEWFRANRKSVADTERAIGALILPELGPLLVEDLTAAVIRDWMEKLVRTPPRLRGPSGTVRYADDWQPTDDNRRARRATGNRVLTILKSALNHAWRNGKIVDDSAWRKVKPFPAVDQPVTQFLTASECQRLLNACAPDFRQVVRAGLLTGLRYGELVRLKAGDVKPGHGGLWVMESKSGKPRFVHLNSEGLEFFSAAVLGKPADEFLFLRDDGTPWGISHQVRRFADALAGAGLPAKFSFHDLRHTYASLLIQAGVSLDVIADLLGHADTRITLRHYAHLADENRRQAVSALPSFGDLPESNVKRLGNTRG